MELHWSRVLDDYRDDNYCWCYAEFHLCTSHLVLVLPHGYHLALGGSKEGTAAQGLYERPRVECLSDEVQTVRPRMSDAAHALRQSRTGDWLSASRLSEMRQMYVGLSYKNHVTMIFHLSLFKLDLSHSFK